MSDAPLHLEDVIDSFDPYELGVGIGYAAARHIARREIELGPEMPVDDVLANLCLDQPRIPQPLHVAIMENGGVADRLQELGDPEAGIIFWTGFRDGARSFVAESSEAS